MFNPHYEAAVRAEVARVGASLNLQHGEDYNLLYRGIAGHAPA